MSKPKIVVLAICAGLVFFAVAGAAPGGQTSGGGGSSALLMLGAAALFVAGAGFYLARRNRPAERVAEVAMPEPDAAAVAARLARMAQAARSSGNEAAGEAAPAPRPRREPGPVTPKPAQPVGTGPGQDAIVTARGRPIVFRQIVPPGTDHGLSFYGGRPVGPATLAWPRHAAAGSAGPLTFVMQWDCRELAAQDATGLLPRDGVLYFFADLTWGTAEAYRFLHAAGDTADWAEIEPPADLPPLFGEETAWQVPWCSARMPQEVQDCPVLLPRWPFRPLGFDYPEVVAEEPEEELFWSESATGNALVAAQDSLGAPLVAFDPQREPSQAFPAFPHDWAAVRIVCSMVIDHPRPANLRLPKEIMAQDVEVRAATVAEWQSEAAELYELAVKHPLAAAVPADLRGDIRAWMDKVEGCFHFSQAVDAAVNASLGLGSAALDVIPLQALARASLKHALGLAYDRSEYRHEFVARCCAGLDPETTEARWQVAQAAGTLRTEHAVHAPSPHRIFGPPSYVQGYVEELVEDHVLLLEISNNSPIGIELGEGVIQFMIHPEDLAAGRFDQARMVASAY